MKHDASPAPPWSTMVITNCMIPLEPRNRWYQESRPWVRILPRGRTLFYWALYYYNSTALLPCMSVYITFWFQVVSPPNGSECSPEAVNQELTYLQKAPIIVAPCTVCAQFDASRRGEIWYTAELLIKNEGTYICTVAGKGEECPLYLTSDLSHEREGTGEV